jgi:hypothetical protein
MIATLDFNLPEGWLDRWFGRPNHRLQVKVERADLIAQFQARVVEIMRQRRHAAEEVRALNQVYYQQLLDALVAWSNAAEQHYRVFLSKERVAQERQIAAAKAGAEIERHNADAAEHRARARNAQRELLPPPPPPPPFDPLEEARRKRREAQELKLQELEDEAEFAQEKVMRAKAEAITIYQASFMCDDEKRTRIWRVLEAFGLNPSILPPAIQDLMEEDPYDDDNV